MKVEMHAAMRQVVRAMAVVAVMIWVADVSAAVVGRAVHTDGDLNATDFDINADGDNFPVEDRQPTDLAAGGTGDGIPDSGSSFFDWFGIAGRSAIDPSADFDFMNGDFLDDSLSVFNGDRIGIVPAGDPFGDPAVPTDTAPFFAVGDTVNDDSNNDTSHFQEAVWTIDTSGATGNLQLSVDVAMMGDSEEDDIYRFDVSYDGGQNYDTVLQSTGIFDTNFETIAMSGIVQEIDQSLEGQDWDSLPDEVKHVLESGTQVGMNDPHVFENVVLKNTFQTFTAFLPDSEGVDEMLVRFAALSDGSVEAFAWRNLTIEDNAAEPGLPGDYNGDGWVDAADYTVWRDNLGDPDETALNDNGDGLNGVDAADYTLWVDNFGMHEGAGSLAAGSVPEPTSMTLVMISLLGFVGFRRPR